MHQLVLNTLPPAQEQEVGRRREQVPGLRSISVGIGGLDLGMSQALARAEGRNEKLQVGRGVAEDQGENDARGAVQGGEGSDRAPGTGGRGGGKRQAGRRGPVGGAMAGPGHTGGDRPASSNVLGPRRRRARPGCGAGDGPRGERERTRARGRAAPARITGAWAGERGNAWTSSGASGKGRAVSWVLSVTGAEGPEPRSRRLIAGGGGGRIVERVEEGRFLRYRFAADGAGLTIAPAPAGCRRHLCSGVGPKARAGAGASEGSAGAVGSSPGSRHDGGPAPGRGRGVRVREAPPCPPPALRPTGVGAGCAPPGPRRGRAGARRCLPGARAAAPRSGPRDRPGPRQTAARASPAAKVLGGPRHLMVLMDPEGAAPPWDGPWRSGPGRKTLSGSPPRSGPGGPPGHRRRRPPRRSSARGRALGRTVDRGAHRSGKPVLLLPEDGFPGSSRGMRDAIATAWKGGASCRPAGGRGPLARAARERRGSCFVRRASSSPRARSGDEGEVPGCVAPWWPGPQRSSRLAPRRGEPRRRWAGGLLAPRSRPRRRGDRRVRGGDRAPGDTDRRPEDVAGPFVWYY